MLPTRSVALLAGRTQQMNEHHRVGPVARNTTAQKCQNAIRPIAVPRLPPHPLTILVSSQELRAVEYD